MSPTAMICQVQLFSKAPEIFESQACRSPSLGGRWKLSNNVLKCGMRDSWPWAVADLGLFFEAVPGIPGRHIAQADVCRLAMATMASTEEWPG